MNGFIVLAAHRSGNTLLLNSLGSHPQVQCHKKVFTLNIVIKRLLILDRSNSPFYKFRIASLKRRLDYIFRKKQLINDFMTELCTPPDGVKAVGVRVIYAQANKHPEILEWAIENDVSIIHLVRENSLKTLVSSATAQKRGLSHSTSRVEPVTIHLSPFKLKLQLSRLTSQIEKYRTLLKDKRHLVISYESLVANREAEMRRMLEFLDIDQFVPMTTDLVKLNPDTLEDIIENYDQVKQALGGTAFEKFLD